MMLTQLILDFIEREKRKRATRMPWHRAKAGRDVVCDGRMQEVVGSFFLS